MSSIQKPLITSSEDAYLQLGQLFDSGTMNIKEEAVVIFLSRGNRVIGGYKLSSRGISDTIFDLRLILSIALKCLATGLIIAHYVK